MNKQTNERVNKQKPNKQTNKKENGDKKAETGKTFVGMGLQRRDVKYLQDGTAEIRI